MEVDETPREGLANRRKRFERGKVAAVMGSVPPGAGLVKLGEVTVPEGVTHIRKIAFSLDFCRGPFSDSSDGEGRRYCITCGQRHRVILMKTLALKRPT